MVDALRQLVGDRLVVARAGRAVAGALAVAVVGAIAWGAYARGASGSAAPPELSMPRAGAGAGVGEGTTTSDAPSAGAGGESTSSSAALVFVHVAGAVARPGVYRLGAGGTPRVADAIDAAGGVVGEADVDALNLAAPVADGERIYVAVVGESPPAAASSVGAGGAPAGPLDLNTATAEQLDSLPGIGPSTAEAIVAHRKERGRFRSVDELLEVRGIGPSKLEDLRAKVRVR